MRMFFFNVFILTGKVILLTGIFKNYCMHCRKLIVLKDNLFMINQFKYK